jgi:hypothetical protein
VELAKEAMIPKKHAQCPDMVPALRRLRQEDSEF